MTGTRTHRGRARRWSTVLWLPVLAVVALGCSVAPGGDPTMTPATAPSAAPEPATPVDAPGTSATASPESKEVPVGESLPVTLTVVYDNNGPTADAVPTDPPLRTGWGFACLVECGDDLLLFDTGGDGGILCGNLKALGVDAAEIDALVLSHYHSDHAGGLDALLEAGATPTVFVPTSFPPSFAAELAANTKVIAVTSPAELAPGVRTTGEMGIGIIEQSLMIETAEGLVVVTGCAHPGIVEVVRRAAGIGEVALVIGGFHLKDSSTTAIDDVIAGLRELGVARVAPTHCSGDRARGRFAEVFGDGFVPVGVGSVVAVGR